MAKKKAEQEPVEIPDGGPLPGEQATDVGDAPDAGGEGEGEDTPEPEPEPVEITKPVESPTAQSFRYASEIAGTPPPPKGPGLPTFRPVPTEESPAQRGFKVFVNARQGDPLRGGKYGDMFHGWFKRAIHKDDADAVGKGHALEFEQWPDRMPVLLPGTDQLWKFFMDIVSEDAGRMKHLFEIELMERVMDKENPSKVHFLRFRIGEE